MAEKLGPRATRIAERDFRGSLESEYEGKFREMVKPAAIKSARAALGWMQRRATAKQIGEK